MCTHREDIRICRTAEGKKCRLGEGGFGIVYKALMNGVDEVAVKLVKADRPSPKEMALFHKEVVRPDISSITCICSTARMTCVSLKCLCLSLAADIQQDRMFQQKVCSDLHSNML